ncbi:WD repeat-containing protein 46, partial [Fundulus heteroclitus]|uniref:WD repeat-containing protein 46 n=1 Tax=Fundulus heteroclitus TaxID=8078 RepID=UPI00165ACDD8
VYRDVWSTPVTKPYMAHRVRGSVWGLHFCPFEDVLGVGHERGFHQHACTRAFDPLAKEKFVPKFKKKGRSSAGGVERRKKQVAHEDQRDVIRKTVEDRRKLEEERKKMEEKKGALSSKKSALERFRK